MLLLWCTHRNKIQKNLQNTYQYSFFYRKGACKHPLVLAACSSFRVETSRTIDHYVFVFIRKVHASINSWWLLLLLFRGRLCLSFLSLHYSSSTSFVLVNFAPVPEEQPLKLGIRLLVRGPVVLRTHDGATNALVGMVAYLF